MNQWMNFVLQVIGFGAQVGVASLVSHPEIAKAAHGAIAVAQGAVAMAASRYNPDGSPASVAYVPRKDM